MDRSKINVFVSFHHEKNQEHANIIRSKIRELGYRDISVNNGTKIENEEQKTDEAIRQEIRDKFLRNVDVTIVIIGSDSINRKHIDWEIRSSIYKFDNSKMGSIVGINAVIENNKTETWILDKKLVELHDGNFFPAGRTWPDKMIRNNYMWMPERLFNSIEQNYSKVDSERGIYNHAVFPIIDYEKAKDRDILDRAILSAIEWKSRNKGKWDVNSKMRRNNNERLDRIYFDQQKP